MTSCCVTLLQSPNTQKTFGALKRQTVHKSQVIPDLIPQLLKNLLLSPFLCSLWKEHQPGSLAMPTLAPVQPLMFESRHLLDKLSKSARPSETLDAKTRLTAAIWYPPTYFLPQDSNPSCPHHTPLGGCCCLCMDVNHVLLMSAKL